mgnify:CR=1 FL=1
MYKYDLSLIWVATGILVVSLVLGFVMSADASNVRIMAVVPSMDVQEAFNSGGLVVDEGLTVKDATSRYWEDGTVTLQSTFNPQGSE